VYTAAYESRLYSQKPHRYEDLLYFATLVLVGGHEDGFHGFSLQMPIVYRSEKVKGIANAQNTVQYAPGWELRR
jgi:hypothetical protein